MLHTRRYARKCLSTFYHCLLSFVCRSCLSGLLRHPSKRCEICRQNADSSVWSTPLRTTPKPKRFVLTQKKLTR